MYFQWNPQDTIENMSKISSQCCFFPHWSSTAALSVLRLGEAARQAEMEPARDVTAAIF